MSDTSNRTARYTTRGTTLPADDPGRYCRLIGHVLDLAYRDIPRPDFVHDILHSIGDDLSCDRVELRQVDRRSLWRWHLNLASGRFLHVATAARASAEGNFVLGMDDDGGLRPIFDSMTYASGGDRLGPPSADGTIVAGAQGALCIADAAAVIDSSDVTVADMLQPRGEIHSLALLPFERSEGRRGLVILGAHGTGHFAPQALPFLEELGRAVGLAQAHRETRRDLRERVKELTCLYGMARVAAEPDQSLDQVLQKCVSLLPPAWFYPNEAAARVRLDAITRTTGEFPENGQRLTAPVIIDGRQRGVVEVAYREGMPSRDDGPFLAEERRLLTTVAEELGKMIEQRRIAQEVHGLKDQLLHADRLATIGQVASGVVHELNEPLGGILGFAQLVKKEPGLPPQARQDVDRIVAAALHSREVVRRLMLFARRTPPRCDRMNLNEIIAEGLYFLESRCERVGIELDRDLQPNLPEISGDPSQLYQVLVNLVVNAIQAIGDGGRVTIRTRAERGAIAMIVEDTGVGMSAAVRERALEPFFTTKGIDEGTGLGLAVVDGIVKAHGGSIEIESEEGRGSRFTISLPLERRKAQSGKATAHE